MKQNHECEDVVGTLDLSIETRSDGAWMMCVWPSGDKEVGDWSLSYGISCCPFCGEKLGEEGVEMAYRYLTYGATFTVPECPGGKFTRINGLWSTDLDGRSHEFPLNYSVIKCN